MIIAMAESIAVLFSKRTLTTSPDYNTQRIRRENCRMVKKDVEGPKTSDIRSAQECTSRLDPVEDPKILNIGTRMNLFYSKSEGVRILKE
jgi:hypothetical protein